MPESLDTIGLRHGTDKASNANDFLSFYARYLEPMREGSVKVLEFGVLNGASLRTWREYFPRGSIIGVDSNPDTLAHASDRISIEIANQSNETDLKRVASLGPFDLVLDDGSHIWSHQIRTFQLLAPAVRPGGFYVIEDLDTSYGRYKAFYGGGISAAAYLHRLSDWVVGNRQMFNDHKLDTHLRAIWPTIDFVVFYQGTGLMQRRLTPRQFPTTIVRPKRSGIAYRLARIGLRKWQERRG